jgi:hypothetical protein
MSATAWFATSLAMNLLHFARREFPVNSFLRGSRSLFSPTILPQLQLKVPSQLSFAGVGFEPRESMKYRSNINVVKLIKLANNELNRSDPPAYAIFLLAGASGLRRKEIDFLKWSPFSVSKKIESALSRLYLFITD